MKTGVLIHGFHLQAENWEMIVWGEPPDLLGRLPKGVLVALQEKAKIIVFGTGASEINGKKEAEYTRDYLLEHFSELADFSAFLKVNLETARKRIERIIRVDVRAQNTAQEVKFVGQIFREVGVEKVILVSSPAHISRCLRDAYAAYSQDEKLRYLTQNLFATPSQTSWADASQVIIIEPSHRPDRLKSNLYSFVEKLMEMPKEEQEEIIKKALTD